MGFARIFRSRWAALLWAGGIVWTAVDVASANGAGANGAGDHLAVNASSPATSDATGENVEAADLAVLANAGG